MKYLVLGFDDDHIDVASQECTFCAFVRRFHDYPAMRQTVGATMIAEVELSPEEERVLWQSRKS